MSTTGQAVLEAEGVIVPPKASKVPPEQMNFRWPPDLIAGIKAIAQATGRTINETGEMLMRWAVERAKAEIEITDDSPMESSRRKKQ